MPEKIKTDRALREDDLLKEVNFSTPNSSVDGVIPDNKRDYLPKYCDWLSDDSYTELVEGSCIDPVIACRNFKDFSDSRELDQFLARHTSQRWKHSDHLVPGMAISGVDPKTGESWGMGSQFKPKNPQIDSEGKCRKYFCVSDCEAEPLFLDTGDSGYWPRVLANPQIPIVLTEGPKKAACLLTLGYAGISVPGVWNGQNKGELRQSIKQFCRVGRTVYLCFDLDYLVNPSVQAVLDRTGRLISAEGSVVKIVTWGGVA